jgi:hypothetical protein
MASDATEAKCRQLAGLLDSMTVAFDRFGTVLRGVIEDGDVTPEAGRRLEEAYARLKLAAGQALGTVLGEVAAARELYARGEG